MAEDMDTGVRAPLASQEAMEESPMQICGHISEYTRGKEFKVGYRLWFKIHIIHYPINYVPSDRMFKQTMIVSDFHNAQTSFDIANIATG